MLQCFKGKHPTERERTPGIENICLSWVLLNTWKLILRYSVAAGLSAKPSLQEGLTSLDNLKDNRAPRWFLYNVHTWTGNRLLSSSQPPPKNYFCTAAILTLTQSRRIPFEGRAPTDSAIRAPGTITCHSSRHERFPRGSFLPLFKPFCQLKRHKRLRALPSSLYKSSAEEDSRHSDILKPRFTGVIYSEAVLKKKKK